MSTSPLDVTMSDATGDAADDGMGEPSTEPPDAVAAQPATTRAARRRSGASSWRMGG
jgi:hypothetical protein